MSATGLREIPQRPQRQDALRAQMRTVYLAANRLGCYDAADWISKAWHGEETDR